MSDALADKRTATRLRVLVEIAERQPAVSQGEIADSVGVTSQAVSEYIRELVDDGLVRKEGRSRYAVTKEGVDWLFQEARGLQRFADHVTNDVLGKASRRTPRLRPRRSKPASRSPSRWKTGCCMRCPATAARPPA